MKSLWKPILKPLLLAGVSLLLAGPAAATDVSVKFVEQDKYRDWLINPHTRAWGVEELGRHVIGLAARLPEGQHLDVEILDIDLAGSLSGGRNHGNDRRVVTGGADWPHMRLRYTVRQGNTVVRSGDEIVSNKIYFKRLNHYSDLLRFEKQMLDDWFKNSVAAR